MRTFRRPYYALAPWRFGRGRVYALAAVLARRPGETVGDDLRLFALTFIGGFLFVSLYLA